MRRFNVVDMEELTDEDVMLSRMETIEIVAEHNATLDWFSDEQAPRPMNGQYSAYQVFAWLGY